MAAVPYRTTFMRLLGFLRPYKASLAVSTVLAIASQLSGIALIAVTGRVVDHALRPHDRHELSVLVWTLVGLGFAKAVLMSARRLISGGRALAIEFDRGNRLYSHLVRLSFGFYDRHQTGQLMSRATVDLQGVRFFLGYGLIFFFQNVLTVVLVTGVLLVFQWKLADVATVAEENIVGVHVVKSFAQEPQEEAKFRRRSEAVFDQTIKANRQRALYVPFISWVPLVAQAAVLLVGARMVTSGELSVGGFVAFNVYLGMLVMPLRSLGMWIGQAQRATASGERIFQVMDEPEEIADHPDAVELPPGGGHVRFDDVSFGYLPGRPVLEHVDLDVAPGSTIALIGHTGSGKTTLTSLVPRFYDVTSGRVTIDGADVRDVTLVSLRRAIGVIPQDPFLFSDTVRENIAFGAPQLSDAEIERAARLAEAHEFIDRLPDGYDTVIGERGITLSGGQRQRLAIARAL